MPRPTACVQCGLDQFCLGYVMNLQFPLAAPCAVALACAAFFSTRAQACDDCDADGPAVAAPSNAPTHRLGLVQVNGAAPTSLPTHIPTTVEGITGAEIERHINATDAEDALKYLPSLLVRKRYTGDYNHAVLSTRASGTGNSARSLVFADGILLSNLLGNGAGFMNSCSGAGNGAGIDMGMGMVWNMALSLGGSLCEPPLASVGSPLVPRS